MATTRNPPTHGHASGRPRPNGNGSGAGRKKKKGPNPFLVGIWRFVCILFWAVLIGAAAVAYYVYKTEKTMPDSVAAIEDYKPTGHTIIYSADGAELADIFSQNRQNVTIDQIPKNLINATVAIEDERFWTDNIGVDPRGIARAIFKDAKTGGFGQGGSTITQQLVRNLGIDGLTREKSIDRKIREWVIANNIEKNYSKQQILEMYLNEVYYGSGSYGVQAAADTYFGKPVGQLDLAQCALIAGLPQRPTGDSPYTDKHAAKVRRNIVLMRMKQLGYISEDQYEDAVSEPIILAFPKAPTGKSRIFYSNYLTNYFIDYLVANLTKNYGSDFVYRGGIKVYTTLNLAMQQQAATIVTQNVASLGWANVSQAALVSIEPQTGYIKAMVGGTNYKDNQFNIAADGLRQPGSSFKPVYYTAALDSGVLHENDIISDDPIDLPGADRGHRWRPQEDDGRFHPPSTARNVLANSYNCASIRIFQRVGIGAAIRYARMMGVHSPLAPYVTLALGTSAVTPLEMADVYATIDNGGARPIITGITKITDDSGNIIENDAPKLETTGISAQACHDMQDMLRAVVTAGTASASFRDNNPPDAVGKTGTTQNHNDVWFDGFTHDLVTIVWAGHPAMRSHKGHHGAYGEALAPNAWGATITVPMWKQFMVAAEGIEQQEKAREAANAAANKPIIITPSTPQDSPSPDNSQDSSPDVNVSPSPSPDGGADGSPIDSPTPDPNATPSDSTGDGTAAPADSPTPTVTPAVLTLPIQPAATPRVFRGAIAPSTPPASTFTQHVFRGAIASSPPPAPTPVPTPKMVTVTVCAETGLLATRWCPETVDETFIAGQQPKRHCTIHHPPPGE